MDLFESNVILDRYKTKWSELYEFLRFESNVILDRYKTRHKGLFVEECLRVMLF